MEEIGCHSVIGSHLSVFSYSHVLTLELLTPMAIGSFVRDCPQAYSNRRRGVEKGKNKSMQEKNPLTVNLCIMLLTKNGQKEGESL